METINVGDSLKTEIMEGNILHVRLGNATSDEDVKKLEDFLEKSHELAVDLYNKTGDMVCGLIDLSHFNSYSPKVVSIIAEVLKDNKPYIKKTATYGANPFIRLAEETVFALAGRNNFKTFDSKEDAINWLTQDILEN